MSENKSVKLNALQLIKEDMKKKERRHQAQLCASGFCKK